jgi:hypothetical protein
MTDNDQYAYWEKALADPKALHNREFKITTDPQSGFYRMWKTLEPVAIWRDDEDAIVIVVHGEEIDPVDFEETWLRCAKYPVTEEAYHHVRSGAVWPDLDEGVAAIGHNRRRGDDPESLIDEMVAAADAYGQEITDDDEAKRAISLRAALLEQHNKLDKVREAAKAPHLKAAREVDEVYMPTVKLAKKTADMLRGLVEAFETRKRQALREAEARRNVQDAPLPEPLDQIRTGYGKAASVRDKLVVTGITNFATATEAYRHHPGLTEALIRLAQADADQGLQKPGFKVETRAIVR